MVIDAVCLPIHLARQRHPFPPMERALAGPYLCEPYRAALTLAQGDRPLLFDDALLEPVRPARPERRRFVISARRGVVSLPHEGNHPGQRDINLLVDNV